MRNQNTTLNPMNFRGACRYSRIASCWFCWANLKNCTSSLRLHESEQRMPTEKKVPRRVSHRIFSVSMNRCCLQGFPVQNWIICCYPQLNWPKYYSEIKFVSKKALTLKCMRFFLEFVIFHDFSRCLRTQAIRQNSIRLWESGSIRLKCVWSYIDATDTIAIGTFHTENSANVLSFDRQVIHLNLGTEWTDGTSSKS